MEKRTYKDWKAHGYQVIKGSKAIARSPAGEALFQSDQVKRIIQSQYDEVGDYEYDDDWMFIDPDLGDR